MTPDPLSIARELLSIPTAPFHEQGVLAHIRALLTDWGIRVRDDAHGNLIASYNKGRGTRWALVAHTDHPGLEVTSCRGTAVKARFLGGVRPDWLQGAQVRLFAAHGDPMAADPCVGTVETVTKGAAEQRLNIRLEQSTPWLKAGCFGHFELGPTLVNKTGIYANAVDDLIGCATTLSVLARLQQEQRPARVVGVFTRAEEVGFVGTQLLVEDQTLPPDTHVISIESSLAMAGAAQGLGPVIRVGDRTSAYDGRVEAHLHQAARRLLENDAQQQTAFCFQRQLMTGGTCEASVFFAAGYATGGLAYPLKNYHNMGADHVLEQEVVATGDYLNGIELLLATVAPGRHRARPAGYLKRLATATATHRNRLQGTP